MSDASFQQASETGTGTDTGDAGFGDFFALLKPRVMSLVVFTAFVGLMAAPTPVSAYLHSATMVKAGIFLLARFFPVFSGTHEWFLLVGGLGLVTLLIAAYFAIWQRDLKGLLAYSTISHLGLITLLFGIGIAIWGALRRICSTLSIAPISSPRCAAAPRGIMVSWSHPNRPATWLRASVWR